MRRFIHNALISAWACCVLSCAKPADPEPMLPVTGGYEVISRLPTPGYAQDVEVRDTLAYLAQGEGGLAIVSIAQRTQPRIISTCQEGVRGYSYKLALGDGVVYVAAAAFGVNVVDVRVPSAPVATASNLNMKPARSFHIFREYLFTSVSELGIKIAEISYPAQPDIRGGVTTPGYARGMTATPDSNYLVVACGEMGFAMFDISDMQSGFGTYPLAGWSDTPGYAVDVALMGNQRYAFLACGTAGVQIIDFADSANVRIVGSYRTGGYAKEIAYRQGRVYVTTESRGLQILSVENVTAPQLVGVVATKYALGLHVDDRYVYIADEVEGLVIVSIPPY